MHLILIAVGPVQDFIAQARRTRDLWFGSHLLSEISKAVAQELNRKDAKLIFPAPKRPEDLEPCDQPFDNQGNPVLNVANKILAEIDENNEKTVAGIASAAREAAYKRWRGLAENVWNEWQGQLEQNCTSELWEEQIESTLEFAATWKAFDANSPNGYTQARDAVEAALAGRKNLRDFEPWQYMIAGGFKSSLDGGRVSVLPHGVNRRKHNLFAEYSIDGNEELDAVGLVKRAGGEPEQFVPIDRIAFGPWLQQAATHKQEILRGWIKALDNPDSPWPKGNISRQPNWLRCFPRDSSLLMPSRWGPMAEERGNTRVVGEAWGRDHIAPRLKELSNLIGEPHPYVACIVADGDRMGQALDKLESADAHRKFSQQLACFAGLARQIVEGESSCGSLVYAGGDDVVAFVAVPHALQVAAKLRQAFLELMQEALKDTGIEPPTLSVGIGISHILESMGAQLELGRQAEKLAKGDSLTDSTLRRNALAIIVDKRSGGQIQWRCQWQHEPARRLTDDIAMLANRRLPSKKIFEIQRDLQRMPDPASVEAAQQAQWARLLRLDTERTLRRAGNEDGGVSTADVGLPFPDPADNWTNLNYSSTRNVILAWIRRMLVARLFSDAEVRERQPQSDIQEVPA